MLGELIRIVSERLSGKEVTSEEEIKRIALRSMLQYFGAKSAGFDHNQLLNQIVESLCDEPISIHSLHYSEVIEIGEMKFRHIHTCKPTKESLELAYNELKKSASFLDSLNVMKDVTDNFFKGYTTEDGLIKLYTHEKYKYGVYYSIIDDVGEDIKIHKDIAKNFDGEYVIVVPTEEELTPFLRFFARYSEDVKMAGFKIWVVDPIKRSIDPFIGYPKDFRLISRFKNPKLATIINSLWRVKVENID
uniref:Uncharacterized protein n=1 Tax=Geoglobus ahangari TaxID=113653 RepID=A0A7C3UEI1_9EURY